MNSTVGRVGGVGSAGRVGRRQWREDTRESGSRRFYLGNNSSFGGYFEIFSRLSSGIRAVDACWIDALTLLG